MPYFIKQKLNLSELVQLDQRRQTVLLVEPEDYLRNLYSLYLSRQSFAVEHCLNSDELEASINFLLPNVLVFSTSYFDKPIVAVRFLSRIRQQFPSLPVVAITFNSSHDHLKQLVSAGVTSHIDRRLTRPEDLATIIKTLLFK